MTRFEQTPRGPVPARKVLSRTVCRMVQKKIPVSLGKHQFQEQHLDQGSRVRLLQQGNLGPLPVHRRKKGKSRVQGPVRVRGGAVHRVMANRAAMAKGARHPQGRLLRGRIPMKMKHRPETSLPHCDGVPEVYGPRKVQQVLVPGRVANNRGPKTRIMVIRQGMARGVARLPLATMRNFMSGCGMWSR